MHRISGQPNNSAFFNIQIRPDTGFDLPYIRSLKKCLCQFIKYSKNVFFKLYKCKKCYVLSTDNKRLNTSYRYVCLFHILLDMMSFKSSRISGIRPATDFLLNIRYPAFRSAGCPLRSVPVSDALIKTQHLFHCNVFFFLSVSCIFFRLICLTTGVVFALFFCASGAHRAERDHQG
jgi:hypothetical protein